MITHNGGLRGGATSPSHQCHNPLNLALRIIAGWHGNLLAFMPSILIKDVNNHLKQTVNDYCHNTLPLPYLMITIITWECVPLVPAKLSFRRARLEVSVISIGAIVMRLQSAVVCGHCERRIEGGATSSSHQCHNPLNTRLRRYRRLALQKHGFAGTGQAAFPTPHSGRHGSRRLHHKIHIFFHIENCSVWSL